MNKLWNKLSGKKQEETEPAVKDGRGLSDSEKHTYRYFLQYTFIPDLASGVSQGELSIAAILKTDGWENYFKKYVDKNFYFEWDELHCKGIRIDDTYVMALYIFPKPRQVPEAAFGAILINTTTNNATYYTLESSFGNEWVLGSMSKTGHCNFGTLESPGLNSFLDWVVERAKEATPIMSTNFPQKKSEDM